MLYRENKCHFAYWYSKKQQQQLTNWIAFFGLSIYWDLAPNITILLTNQVLPMWFREQNIFSYNGQKQGCRHALVDE